MLLSHTLWGFSIYKHRQKLNQVSYTLTICNNINLDPVYQCKDYIQENKESCEKERERIFSAGVKVCHIKHNVTSNNQ